MKRVLALATVLVLTIISCGGGAEPSNQSAGSGDSSSGGDRSGGGDNLADQQPPGQGYASVDGLEYTLNLPGGLACEVSDEEFSFSYVIGDNEVALGGGGSLFGDEWSGSLSLRIFANNMVTEYVAKILDNPAAVAIDGESVSYSGPMEKYAPSSDGSPSEPEDVGDGTFSATCG